MSPALIVSAVLFGLLAAMSLVVGLFVPFAIRANGGYPGPPGLFHPWPHAALVGAEPVGRARRVPRPDARLFGSEPVGERDAARVRMLGIMHLDWLSGNLVSVGILGLGVVWFGLARGEVWAYVLLVLANLAVAPYYALIVGRYVRAGVRLRLIEVPPLMWVPAFALPVAIILGWVGLPK